MAEAFDVTFNSLKRKLVDSAKEVQVINEKGRAALKDVEQQNSFKGMFKVLEKYYTRFENLWDEILDLCEKEKKSAIFPTEVDTTLQTKAKRYYYEAYASFEALATSKAGPSRQSINPNDTMTFEGRANKNLPRINLPHFNGQINNWPRFRDAFTSIIHNDALLSKMEKFHYLVSSLTGSASAVISNLPLVDDNYEIAWTALNDTFNNKRMLASTYLNQLIGFKTLQGKTTIDSLQLFLSQVSDSVAAFKLLKIPNEADFILFHIAVRLLDPSTREQFELSHKDSEFPIFDDLSKFLRERCLALQLSSGNSVQSVTEPKNVNSSFKANNFKAISSSRNMKTALFADSSSNSLKKNNYTSSSCIFCDNGAHALYACKTFIEATEEERHDKLKNWKGCKNCLSYYHSTGKCSSKWNCKFCRKRHHSLLHLPTSPSSSKDRNPENTVNTNTSSALTAVLPQYSHILLGTVVAEIQDSLGNFRPVRLVIDSGSQHSFITTKCTSRLGLKTSHFPQKISAIGQTIFDGAKGKATCLLRPRNSNSPLLKTEAVVINNITSHLPNFELPHSIWSEYIQYDLADPTFYEPGPIDFLLGSDLFPDILSGPTVIVRDKQPKLLQSVFGFIVIGGVSGCSSSSGPSSTSFFTIVQSCDDLQIQLQRFWELEEPIKRSKDNPQELACEEHFKHTHYRLDGQYVVRLPLKEPDCQFPNSSDCSLRRFHSLERKLDRNPLLKSEYSSFMREYLELGHMNVAISQSKFVIPHHCVTKEDRSKIKLRVVFDASAEASSSSGSLNKNLMPGPKLQKDIRDILLRFRLHPVAFVADVVKMYRQILLDPQDRAYQHIFWRFDNSEAIQKYELNTVTYGLNCAPFLALRVIKQLEIDEGSRFPRAASIISSDMYVDDIVTGASSIEEALVLQQEVIDLLGKGHFSLSKWASNSKEILKAVNTDYQTDHVSLTSNEDPNIKILGLQWNPNEDTFSYNIRNFVTVYSKRSILSTIAKIYDPLGFLAPSIFIAKILIQDLWKLKTDWDAEIPCHLKVVWEKFTTLLPTLQLIKIPRWITTNDPHQYQLIGFCDASSQGYCAAIYLRIVSCNLISSHLLTARTKLAPIKTMSIPRLELCAAHLLAKTYLYISSSFSHITASNCLQPILFSDASVVLGWINTPSYKLKTFIANRVVHITDLTPVSFWRHVKSEDNPSDCGSRGLQPDKLLHCDMWWFGPKWLCLPEENWPKSSINLQQQELPELKPEPKILFSSSEEPELLQIMSRYSSYQKFLRVFTWVRRFINNLQVKLKKRNLQLGPLSFAEIDDSVVFCSKFLQQHYLFKNKDSTGDTAIRSLHKLSPYLDDQGVLRVGGRLTNADISYRQKHPIILPKCHFTVIMIDYYHKMYLHPGPLLLQALIQLKFWIPGLRTLVRKRTFMCLKCYKEKANTFTPKMADLPRERVNPGRTFQHVGVDFAGPLIMKESLRRKSATSKVYICLFICLASKALHLELVTSLSTEAFLAAFSRFISRRGLPQQVFSDCGTNFQGAANRLRDFGKWYCKESTQDDIRHNISKIEVNWNFNPPSSPHFGGIWEAGVKSAKTILRRVVGETVLTYEEISTLLTKVEAILNSRPLCPLSSSPEETNYLSPGHFLVGGPIVTPPEPSLLDCKVAGLSRWQHLQKMIQHFWKRWRVEYLSTLQRRGKWTKDSPNPREGDLVLLKEDNVPVLQWPLAKIMKLHPGDDGVVRVMTIKTATSEFKRPAVKLVPLLPLNTKDF